MVWTELLVGIIVIAIGAAMMLSAEIDRSEARMWAGSMVLVVGCVIVVLTGFEIR